MTFVTGNDLTNKTLTYLHKVADNLYNDIEMNNYYFFRSDLSRGLIQVQVDGC
jgi:hypothetical protein